MDEGLDIICGRCLDGGSVTEEQPLAPGSALVGRAAFGPSALLSDLELRLGLAPRVAAYAVRVARWSARMARLVEANPFYARSYAVDAWGAAAELLHWRDSLVAAGWDGAPIRDGGDRLQSLVELEALRDPDPLPPSEGDRLAALESALRAAPRRVYDRIRHAGPLALWSRRWRDVFGALQANGCRLDPVEVGFALASPTTDLGALQRHILHGGAFVPPKGDGSLLLVRGETTWETAHAVSALLRSWSDGSRGGAVVVRGGEEPALDLCLARAGLASQGARSTSRFRPILQVLPLALELAFEPKDPHRMLELLAIPDGPFGGVVGGRLAEALAEMPGLANEEWERAKVKIAESIRARTARDVAAAGGDAAAAEEQAEEEIARRMGRVTDWIEAPGHPQKGAPRGALLEVVRRVQKWLQGRLAGAQENDDERASLLGAAYADAASLVDALTADPRNELSLVQVRQLVEGIAGTGGGVWLSTERAGRIDHVARPRGLLRSRPLVAWWCCTAEGAETARALPLRRSESDALRSAGVDLIDLRAEMADAALGWRRAVLAASERLVLAAPRFRGGEEVAVHPIWDELCARMGGARHDLARVSFDAREILGGRGAAGGVATVPVVATSLPDGRAMWQVATPHLGPAERASATSLEALIGCPLRWVLDYRANVRDGSLVSLPAEHILYGKLGHRLIELLHKGGAFELNGAGLRKRAHATLDELVRREAATLLLPGKAGELAQVRHQLAKAAVHLADVLKRSKLEIVEVERKEEVSWGSRTLAGRLDLLLVDRDQRDVVLDLKWGRTSYVEKLRSGTALQLAVYAYLRKTAGGGGAFPAVAYFSLSSGTPLATDDATFDGAQVTGGDDIETTWARTETAAQLVERTLTSGRIPVAGVSRALAVVEACGAPDGGGALSLASDAACTYCVHDPVCGRRWEQLS